MCKIFNHHINKNKSFSKTRYNTSRIAEFECKTTEDIKEVPQFMV